MEIKQLAFAIAEILASEHIESPNISIEGHDYGMDLNIHIHIPEMHFDKGEVRCAITENKYRQDDKLRRNIEILMQAIAERNEELQRMIKRLHETPHH